MKQNTHFRKGVAEFKPATMALELLGLINHNQGFQNLKRL
jgi:hypothetical protein